MALSVASATHSVEGETACPVLLRPTSVGLASAVIHIEGCIVSQMVRGSCNAAA